MHVLRLFFTCILIGLSPLFYQAHGQHGGHSRIKNYSKNEYQSGTQNWDIDQDKNGNIYFANNSGLLQFDGTEWYKYSIPNSANIRSVAVDNQSGRIYIGAYNEFGFMQSDESGALKYHSLVSKIKDEANRNFDYIWKIHILQNEVIFQSFNAIYILKDDQINLIHAPVRFQFSFYVDNTLYIQDIAEGIYEYNNGNLDLIPESNVFNSSEIWGMFALPKDKILIATLDKGLYQLHDDKITSWETEANDFVLKNSSLGGTVSRNNQLILNTVLDGVIVCDLEGEIVQKINLKSGLQNNTILSSYIDEKQNLWLGLDNGISYVNINSPFSYLSSELYFSSVYRSIIHKDLIYVATNQGVFYNKLSDALKNKPFLKVEGTAVQSWNIQLIDDQLICANNNGALIIDGGKVSQILDSKGYFGFKEIPNHPSYVIGASYSGFTIFKKTSIGLQFHQYLEGFDISTTFFEIDHKFLWVQKNQYLYQLKLSQDLSRLDIVNTLTEFAPNSYTSMLAKIGGEIKFKSNNKFYKYSNEQNDFIPDEKLTKLFENAPSAYLFKEDKLGNIWFSSDQSLGQFILMENGEYKLNPEPFSSLNGNLVVNYLAICALDKDRTFIGLVDGLALYDASIPINDQIKPKVFIRSFEYNDKTTTYGNPQETFWDHQIPYSANNVKFTFSSPEFEQNANIEYAYKLEPFEDKWSDWTKNSFKEYTNLREGNYEMKVKVINNFGSESDLAQLSFEVTPPWYRHILAYITYFLLMLLSIYVIYSRVQVKIRKNKYYEMIEQRKIYLEREAKIKMEQYQLEKEIEKLNRDKLQTSILAKDKELVNNSLQVVKKNKILNGIIKKLKEMDTTTTDEKTKSQLLRLQKGIIKEVNNDNSWKDLEKHIKNVHFDFLKRLKDKYPNISPRELDLSTYLLINMSTKEIAEVMNITTGGVELARYRLRKKLGLERKQNLTGFLMDI